MIRHEAVGEASEAVFLARGIESAAAECGGAWLAETRRAETGRGYEVVDVGAEVVEGPETRRLPEMTSGVHGLMFSRSEDAAATSGCHFG